MNNYKDIITESFVAKLLKELNGIGITTYNIDCIMLEGSSLYLNNFNDLDFKIIVKRYFPKAETLKCFEIDGYKVECCYYTNQDWSKVMNYKKDAHYIMESPDMICVYGDDSNFYRYDTSNKSIQRYVLNIFDKYFFNYDAKRKGTYQMKDKRLWNFLLFAFKVKNESNALSSAQIEKMQKAHDGDLTKADCKYLFDELKEIIYG